MEYRELDEGIRKKLARVAKNLSSPFCYHCYQDAPDGRCSKCGSDDLMRELPGVAVEWGYMWIIEHIIKFELDALTEKRKKEMFDECIESVYGETVNVAGMEIGTIEIYKNMRSYDYDINMTNYFTEMENVVEVDEQLFLKEEVEELAQDLVARVETGEHLELNKKAEIKPHHKNRGDGDE